MDEDLRDELEVHLSTLKRQRVISTWHDRRLLAGDAHNQGISAELDKADVILLLVSPDFLASDYCYGTEMKRALELHAVGAARVIPVILRPCDWQHTQLGGLTVLPNGGVPITSFENRDEAFATVALALRTVAREATVTERRPVGADPLSRAVEDFGCLRKEVFFEATIGHACSSRHCCLGFRFVAPAS
jgi:hypothetical protein